MEFLVVIPARFASTRLPGKALADLAGKPMVVRVADQAKASGAREIVVATDDQRIAAEVERFGYTAVMTRSDHATGTDRIAEVASLRGWADEQIVVNVQGDEPRIDPDLIRDTAAHLARHPIASISTACHPIRDPAHLTDTNVVKVVLDKEGLALYFSRAPIPWARDAFAVNPGSLPDGLPVYRHVGIYAYRCSFLKAYPHLPAPAMERFEALEQLRALWHGYRIAVGISPHAPAVGVDTPADLKAMRRTFAGI
jgi:3-deoxy-manno-octulosonate cytidylyltransferase (CMP-KDO synthetase)